MNYSIEGLVLKKTPYQDRHLIIQILLRTGKKVSVVFHGGRGGGSKKKDSVLELGHMLKVEVKQTNTNKELYSAKEWTTLWVHKKIRENHKNFYVMCFILELAYKMSLDDNLHDQLRESDQSHVGLFRVVSNALFQLEKSSLNAKTQANIFLIKLLIEFGIFPDLSRCVISGEPIDSSSNVTFLFEQGGFVLKEYLNVEQITRNENELNVLVFMKKVSSTKYSDIDTLADLVESYTQLIMNYLAFHFQLDVNSFKSLKLII